jgi:uncharacterized protein YneF (UPF0154 family)
MVAIAIIVIFFGVVLGYKINSDDKVIKSNLHEESKNFILEAKRIRTLMVEGGDNPYHKDMSTDYLEITDTRMDSKDKLLNLMENYFTKEYAEKRFNQLYFEKDNKLCMNIVGDVRIYDFNTAQIGNISINPFSKSVVLELYVYAPIHNEVNRVVFKLKSINGEYRIDENIGGW